MIKHTFACFFRKKEGFFVRVTGFFLEKKQEPINPLADINS
jgi:hypothetical protein